MDSLFLEEAPEQSSDPQEVLDFVIEKVMKKVLLSLTQNFTLLYLAQVIT